MALTRQALTSILAAFTENAIAKGDQKWGRQLASLLESYANQLRARFGHAVALEGAAKTQANRRAEAKRAIGSPPSKEFIRVRALLLEYPEMTDAELHEDFALLGETVEQAVIDAVRIAVNC